MRRFCLLAGCLALAALPAVLRGAPADPATGSSARVEAKDAATASTPAKATAVAHPTLRSRGRSGQWVYVDPKTGRLTDRPIAAGAIGTQRQPSAPSLSTSTEGLQSVPIPGGGVLVDVRGRFRSVLVATVGKDGRLTIRHEPAPSREKE